MWDEAGGVDTPLSSHEHAPVSPNFLSPSPLFCVACPAQPGPVSLPGTCHHPSHSGFFWGVLFSGLRSNTHKRALGWLSQSLCSFPNPNPGTAAVATSLATRHPKFPSSLEKQELLTNTTVVRPTGMCRISGKGRKEEAGGQRGFPLGVC